MWDWQYNISHNILGYFPHPTIYEPSDLVGQLIIATQSCPIKTCVLDLLACNHLGFCTCWSHASKYIITSTYDKVPSGTSLWSHTNSLDYGFHTCKSDESTWRPITNMCFLGHVMWQLWTILSLVFEVND